MFIFLFETDHGILVEWMLHSARNLPLFVQIVFSEIRIGPLKKCDIFPYLFC